ncbi:MAG: M48 family metallopeptidase [Myxococcota bacterium]|nr:M48 family metallopeptidase [Myxococcota bacterium]
MASSDDAGFRGTVMRDGAAGMPLTATITIEAGALRARTDGGDGVEIALSSLTLAPGGFEGDFVFCRPTSGGVTIAVSDPAFVEALRETGVPSLEPQLVKVTKHRASARRGAWISMGVVAVVLLAIAGLLWSTPTLLAASVSALPTSIDRQLGDAAWDETSLGGPERDEPAVRAPVEEIVARFAPEAEGHELRVTIIESEEVNAFTLPGGRIVVYTGLLRDAESPEQVAGVLAHELAHVTRRHGMRNLAHRAGIALALQLLIGGDADAWTLLAADAAVLARQSGYSREQESEADADAVRTMSRAGLDPRALAGFFRVMQRAESGAGSGALTSWLSTHPDHAVRIAHVEALAQDTPPGRVRPLVADWSALRAALSGP